MRVLTIGNMYPPHHLGGYELMWRAAVERLRERGDEVRVLTTDFHAERPDPSIAEDPSASRELRWYWHDHGFPRLGLAARARLERHNHRRLRRELDRFRPHVVGWWAMGGMSLSLIEAVRRRGLAAVGFVHDDWMLYGPDVDAWTRICRRPAAPAPVIERLVGVPARVDLSAAATWAFVSETTRRRALDAVALARPTVLSSGVDSSLFGPRPAKPWAGRLAYVGRIDERKGISTAIRALALLPGARLSVCGDGDAAHLAELRALTTQLGVAERVRFERSPRGRVWDRYAEADAIVFPVLWEEPWGLVPLEAMATGTPVIATGKGGSAEYLRAGENCLLFAPPDDPAALAAAVERLAGDRKLCARLREGGHDTARRHSQERFCTGVGELLDAALALRP